MLFMFLLHEAQARETQGQGGQGGKERRQEGREEGAKGREERVKCIYKESKS